MAKHTFNNSDLAHAFFHQEEFGIDYGNGYNFSFKGDRLYSYSSVLGILIPEKNIFLFRAGRYSSSTSKHQAYIRRAIPHNIKTYYWQEWEIRKNRTYFSYGSSFGAEENTYREYIERAIDSVKEDKNALKSGIGYFGNPTLIIGTRQDVEQFCKDLDCEYLLQEYLPKFDELAWTEKELEVHSVKTWCKNNEIKGSYETKLKVYNNPELAAKVIEKARVKNEKLEATKEERRLKAIQKSIDKWYVGESDEINFQIPKRNNWNYRNKLPVYLRINPKDPKMVDTSKGVTIPLVECALLYRKFRQCVNTNTEWKQNGEKFRIGYYNVESIIKWSNDWMLCAGCHRIFQSQIEEFVDKFVPEWKN